MLGGSFWLLWKRSRSVEIRRVALVGDSHSQALFPRLRPRLEAAGLEVVLQESKPGWSLERFVSDGVVGRLKAVRPDLLVVSLGGNDRPQEDYETKIQAFLAAVDTLVVWNGPADTSPIADATVATAHDQVRNRLSTLLGPAFFDAYPWTDSGHREDGVHFGSNGYDRWAQALTGRLLPTSQPVLGSRP